MLSFKCPECDGPRSCCSCPRVDEDADKPVCKNKGGLVGANGECLLCTAEAGEVCR